MTVETSLKSVLYQVLRKKDPLLWNSLNSTWEFARKEILRLIPNPNGMHNGEPHTRNVVKRLDELIPRSLHNSFEPLEIFVLLCASILHDVGKIPDLQVQFGKQGVTHEEIGKKWVIQDWAKLNLVNEHVASLVASVIYGHSKQRIDWLQQTGELPSAPHHIEGWKGLDPPFLACLLRLADELDESYTRTSPFIERFNFNDIRDKRACIRSIVISPEQFTIEIHASPKSFKIEAFLYKYREWLQDRLDGVIPYISKHGLYYRVVDLIIDRCSLMGLRNVDSEPGELAEWAEEAALPRLFEMASYYDSNVREAVVSALSRLVMHKSVLRRIEEMTRDPDVSVSGTAKKELDNIRKLYTVSDFPKKRQNNP